MQAQPSDTSDRRTYKLRQGCELRVEVKADYEASAVLQEGQAEVFGTALIVGQPVVLRGQKVAIFTWQGCTLDIFTEDYPIGVAVDLIYEAEETPMAHYLNTHYALHAQRSASLEQQRQGLPQPPGPRAMIVGPTDSGKSTLCKILANYAVRQGSAPVLVDLDIGQGSLTPPGNICATPCEVPVDIEEGFALEAPLVYYFGHITPTDNDALYRSLVGRMADMLQARAHASPEANAAGLIINTMGWIDGLGYELLLASMKLLQVDTVLVLGDDRLYNQITMQLQHSKQKPKVVKLPKSGGVVIRPTPMRKDARTQRVRDYFYGPCNELSPHALRLRFDEVRIFRIGGGFRAPTSALPIGSQSVADPLRVTPATLNMDLLHTLLAISHATNEEELTAQNIAGFLYVKDVDMAEQTLVCLAPSGGDLPGKLLLAGSFKVYFE